ncbi:hypothetical protein AB0M54_44845 [Actinoplanes sp. NPDC051470]|uniref:hypothetical protein n=1 Tax=Actinoplanes sp. NPDC051470 TaxID=3157224 RepID=UPI003420F2B2
MSAEHSGAVAGPFGFRVTEQTAVPLTEQTRQLCCAPYVNGEFANQVIGEVIEDEHRAVAPSFGFDLAAVVRHCYQARRILLLRNALLTGLLGAGLGYVQKPTITLLTVGALMHTVRFVRTRRPSRRQRVFLPVILHHLLGWAPFLVAALVYFGLPLAGQAGAALRPFTGLSRDDLSGDALLDLASRTGEAVWHLAAGPVALAVLTLAVLVGYHVITYRILTSSLAHSEYPVLPPLPNARIARRVARVATAQYGNVTVHSADPFLGTGDVVRAWSFALRLRRHSRDGAPGEPVMLDPLKINDEVRRRLMELGDEDLSHQQRVPGTCLVPHIVADGLLDLDDELVCGRERLTFPVAAPATVDAIIRHPQGGLRHFQRVVVGNVVAGEADNAVRTDDGRVVARLRHQEVGVSAFVHLAVEGGLLYVEFVATVLPPVQHRYHLLDALHGSAGRQWGRAIGQAWRGWVTDTAAAPWRLGRGVWRVSTGRSRMNRAERASREFRRYDYGARLSVRTLAAEPEPVTYLQKLDAEKYVKLIERVTAESVLDHLERHHIDTAEFSRRVSVIQDNSIHISGSTFQAATAIGVTGSVTQLQN